MKFENMEINNVTEQAIQISMFYEFSTVQPKSSEPSDFRNIEIRNITGKNAKTGVQLKGLPEHKLKNITLENIDITAENALECSDTENIEMKNVNVRDAKNGGTVK